MSRLMATWSRADLTYKMASPWLGKPVATMALDLRTAADRVRAITPDIAGVISVGASRIANADPYDGVGFGQVDPYLRPVSRQHP
jgi:hypothetical protein